MVTCLDTSYDLRIDTETLGNGNHLLRMLRREVNLEAMTHIEHLVHLSPISTALLMNGLEERRNREKIILDYADIVTHKVKDLGLGAARACTIPWI